MRIPSDYYVASLRLSPPRMGAGRKALWGLIHGWYVTSHHNMATGYLHIPWQGKKALSDDLTVATSPLSPPGKDYPQTRYIVLHYPKESSVSISFRPPHPSVIDLWLRLRCQPLRGCCTHRGEGFTWHIWLTKWTPISLILMIYRCVRHPP